MAMQVAKKGSRVSNVKIRISKKAKTITFNTGFMRKHSLEKENANFIRQGFDKETNKIGIEFHKENDNSGELLRLTYSASGSSATCPVRPILSVFNLDISEIAGDYDEKAIEGPIKISGFAKSGFLLDTSQRKK